MAALGGIAQVFKNLQRPETRLLVTHNARYWFPRSSRLDVYCEV
jgi:hypothetical protein